MCQYHCEPPANRALVWYLSTNNKQISTLTSVSTCPFTEYHTATGRKSSTCSVCMCLGLLHHDIAANASRDGHSPNGNSAGDASGHTSGHSSSQPPASSADSNSPSHLDNQHDSHNMSTLTHSRTGATFAHNASATQRSEQMPQHVALIPRSALLEGGDLSFETSAAHTSSLLDAQHYGSMNTNVPLYRQSSVFMEVTNNGEVTELVARGELYTGSGNSDTPQVSHSDRTLACSVSDAGIVRAPSSPRKPISSHWVSPSNAPNLATAQRAKERGHKPNSASGSPTKSNVLRGSRSMADIGRPHVAEGSSFLTKTAHVALESSLASPTAGRSSMKHHHASKPAWNSPTGSPRRESPQQQAHLIMRTSPTKTTFPTIETALHGHRRGTSSVATSMAGDSVYHSADSSPVRDEAGLTPGFDSAAEVLDDEDNHITELRLSADLDNAQNLSFVHTSVKVATVGRTSKPRLRIDIPFTDARATAVDKSSTSHTSATSSSAASNNPASVSSISRIPRVVAAGNVSSAHAPTRSSTLKRAQSAKSLTSPKTKSHSQSQDPQRQPNTPPAVSLRHVRTVDSSGKTPILSRHPAQDCVPSTKSVSTAGTDLSPAQQTRDTIKHISSLLQKSNLEDQQAQKSQCTDSRTENARASSVSTVRVTPVLTDSLVLDPAIVYSKKSGACGMIPSPLFHIPDIIVMMAYNLK
jgi:hypothetical protein